MKKQLFATTAIVAAFGMGASAAQAQDASLSLSAFSNFYANWTDQDTPGGGYHESDYDFSTNTEFSVNGEVTLDNGITAGMMVQVEADNADGISDDSPSGMADGDNIDENIVYLEGSFGRVELGHEDGVSDTMWYGAESLKAAYPATYNNTTGSMVNIVGNAPILPAFGDSGDATKINYFTPRFAGFQLGITHAPDGNADPVFPYREDDERTDLWEGGANYVNSFNGLDLAASLTGTTYNGNNGGDNWNATPGLVLGYAGFEIGGSAGFGEIGGEDVVAYDAGIGYSTGPWSLSVTGFMAEADNPGGGTDERSEVNAAINYALGPGVSVYAVGAVGEFDNDSAADNDYTTLLGGVGVSF